MLVRFAAVAGLSFALVSCANVIQFPRDSGDLSLNMRQIPLVHNLDRDTPQIDHFSNQIDMAGSMFFLTNGDIRIAGSTICILATDWDEGLMQRLDTFNSSSRRSQRSYLRNLQDGIGSDIRSYLHESRLRERANVVLVGIDQAASDCADGGPGIMIRSRIEWMRDIDAVRTVVTIRQGSRFNIFVRQKSFSAPGNLNQTLTVTAEGSESAAGHKIYEDATILADGAAYYLFLSNGLDIQQRSY